MSADVDELILEAWRREADHAQRRLERLEDQLATIATLSLGTAVLGVGAIRYVADYKGEVLDFVAIAGVVLVGIAGALAIGARARIRSSHPSHGSASAASPPPPCANEEPQTVLQDLARLEQERTTLTDQKGVVAQQYLFKALIIYVSGIVLIAVPVYVALP